MTISDKKTLCHAMLAHLSYGGYQLPLTTSILPPKDGMPRYATVCKRYAAWRGRRYAKGGGYILDIPPCGMASTCGSAWGHAMPDASAYRHFSGGMKK